MTTVTRYKVYRAFMRGTKLAKLVCRDTGKQLRLEDRHEAVSYRIVVEPWELYSTPELAMEAYRQAISFKIQKLNEQILMLQDELDSTPTIEALISTLEPVTP